jgi:hypothetical protein
LPLIQRLAEYNVNEPEKVTDPLTRLAPLATLSPKGARARIQVDASLAEMMRITSSPLSLKKVPGRREKIVL